MITPPKTPTLYIVYI